MPNCDYCGAHFFGGSIQRGKYKFCNWACDDKGRILEVLDGLTNQQIEEYFEAARSGPCEKCGARANVDIHPSYRVYSVGVYTKWQTMTHFCCQRCGRKQQFKDMCFCLVAGWWGIPWGIFVTPWQIGRNMIAMMRGADRASEDFKRIMKIVLAENLVRKST